jgi:hypothetical protein
MVSRCTFSGPVLSSKAPGLQNLKPSTLKRPSLTKFAQGAKRFVILVGSRKLLASKPGPFVPEALSSRNPMWAVWTLSLGSQECMCALRTPSNTFHKKSKSDCRVFGHLPKKVRKRIRDVRTPSGTFYRKSERRLWAVGPCKLGRMWAVRTRSRGSQKTQLDTFYKKARPASKCFSTLFANSTPSLLRLV